MLVDRHITLTASGDTNLAILAAWHVDNRDVGEVLVHIRSGGVAGTIVVPLSVPGKSSVGNCYEHPLNADPNGNGLAWYVEIIGANCTVSCSGR